MKKNRCVKITISSRAYTWSIKKLKDYQRPGNVREIENSVERELIINKQGPLTSKMITASEKKKPLMSNGPDIENIPDYEDLVSGYIKGVHRLTHGKIHGPYGAAELMRLNPGTLRSKMEKLKITYRKKKQLL